MNQLYFDATEFDLRYAQDPIPMFETADRWITMKEKQDFIRETQQQAAMDLRMSDTSYSILYVPGSWE